MKKIHTIYVSFLLILSLFIVFLNQKNIITFNAQDINVNASISPNKTIYLTFDDGPSENTIKILDILDKYEIPATFFVVGPAYKLKNDLLKEIIKKGHQLAIHSYTHEYSKIYASKEAFLEDFFSCKNWIYETTNYEPIIYRFPGGSSNAITSKKTILSIIDSLDDLGYFHSDWNVDSFDSHYNNDANSIIDTTFHYININETNKIYSQTILLHDNTKKVGTIKALPQIIEKCLSKGYQFKTLDKKHLIQHIKKP